jgi:restriction system protein
LNRASFAINNSGRRSRYTLECAMPVPGHQSMMRPLLEILSDGKDHVVRQAMQQIADKLALTDADREELIPSGTQRLLDNRVGWARTYLLKAGLVEAAGRGIIRITDRGRQAVATSQPINNAFLRQFPEFLEFVRGSAADVGQPEGGVSQAPAPETTPEELMDAGFQQIQKALASDLLDRVKSASPAFFERLVVELLVKMGYGGSLGDAGRAVGKSGDHGIDGIIKEDRLGLDVIYLQAKRWESTVGRPEIQQFAGALQGQRARKGVFITTSSFSSEARQYAAAIESRIVLIDGTELAQLMITHGVGVTPMAVYELKRVDSDYFSEE